MNKLILTCSIFVICLLGIALSNIINPQLRYIPIADELPSWIEDPNDAPDQVVIEFLEGTVLPTSGTQLDQTANTLEWDIDGPSQIVSSDYTITDVVVDSVDFSSVHSLVSNVFDDDPIHGASVNTTVKTANGKTSLLTINLWDYGLITPWSIYPSGDGWKPAKVIYID